MNRDILEDYRAATVITSVDYSKAFNRMSYQHCLSSLAKNGASTELLRLVATFLTNRTMTVKVGSVLSSPLPATGGCPQGSILGVFLFNATQSMTLKRALLASAMMNRTSGMSWRWRPVTHRPTSMILYALSQVRRKVHRMTLSTAAVMQKTPWDGYGERPVRHLAETEDRWGLDSCPVQSLVCMESEGDPDSAWGRSD